MPYKPKTPCRHPGCVELVPAGKKYCEKHAPLHRHDRPGAAERGYDARWRKAREEFLRAHPLCEKCMQETKITLATVVDHRIPHRGDPRLFWDMRNWQALCKTCHDRKTMTEDRWKEYRY